MCEGWKKKLRKAKETGKRVKIMFNFPNSTEAKARRGIIKEVYEDCFEIDEIFEGEVSYSYNYISQVQYDNKNSPNNPLKGGNIKHGYK